MSFSDADRTARPGLPAYVIRFIQTFDVALEASRFLQDRLLRWYYIALAVGLALGVIAAILNLTFGLAIAFFCGAMLLMAHFSVMDRLFSRRRARSALDRPIELTLGDDGIDWDGPQAMSHIPWSSVTEVRANARTVIFVGDRLLLAYAPSEAFASPEQRTEAIAYSQQRVDAAASARGPARID